MDAQKISEAASTIKKAMYAEAWFNEAMVQNKVEDTLRIETVGDMTMMPGYGQACAFLNMAMEEFKVQIFYRANDLAGIAKAQAQDVIRYEAGK